ncbi:MAG: ycfH [Firmicutes bacterium]|nr:ycfH [Bacillota bacterium]
MLFDSHAHVDDRRFKDDQDEVVSRAKEAGVTAFINVGADMFSSARSIAIAEKYESVYAAVGVHPHDAKDIRDEDYDKLATWSKHPKVVAIGEIGLDYHYDYSPRDIQQAVFIRQLALACKLQKPVILHDRESQGDLMAIVKEHCQGMTGVFHCFSGSTEMARQVLAMGFYISLAGPVTFTNANKLKAVAQEVPLDRLLVETDSPYLTPHPNRGKRNEPAYVRLVAEEVARLRGITLEELAEATTANVKRLFSIK